MTEGHSSHRDSQKRGQNEHPLLRTIITGGGAIGTALLGIYFSCLLIRQSLSKDFIPQNWFVRIEERHYAALIGTPMSAMTAFCIVTLLKVTNGPIEFEALGVTFRVASGPIILCGFVFRRSGCRFPYFMVVSIEDMPPGERITVADNLYAVHNPIPRRH